MSKQVKFFIYILMIGFFMVVISEVEKYYVILPRYTKLDDHWFTCNVPDDCVKVNDGCRELAVSRPSAEVFAVYSLEQRLSEKDTTCFSVDTFPPKMMPKCEYGHCHM